eukprot:gene7300-5142_t
MITFGGAELIGLLLCFAASLPLFSEAHPMMTPSHPQRMKRELSSTFSATATHAHYAVTVMGGAFGVHAAVFFIIFFSLDRASALLGFLSLYFLVSSLKERRRHAEEKQIKGFILAKRETKEKKREEKEQASPSWGVSCSLFFFGSLLVFLNTPFFDLGFNLRQPALAHRLLVSSPNNGQSLTIAQRRVPEQEEQKERSQDKTNSLVMHSLSLLLKKKLRGEAN